MYVSIRTNLDLDGRDQFPNDFPEVPKIGHYIESVYKYPSGTVLRLRVASVTWKTKKETSFGDEVLVTYPEVELGVPRHFKSLNDFFEWYGGPRMTGRGKHAFI